MTRLAGIEARRSPRQPGLAWWLILGVVAADAVCLLMGALTRPWHIAWAAQEMVAAGSAVLLVIWWVYGSIRPAPRLAGMARTALLFALYTNAVGTLSYLLTGTLQLPLLDRQLDAMDHALGFDWMAVHQWLWSPRWLRIATILLYACLGPELILLILLLDLCGRGDRARELFLTFVISSLAVTVLGELLPAAGAFVEYATPEAHTTRYVLDYLGLRDGSLRSIDAVTMQGVVQFPSFHAALAALSAYAVRGMRWLFAPSLLLNVLVIVVTPAAGGHYLVDVLAGLLLAAATIALLRYCPKRNKR